MAYLPKYRDEDDADPRKATPARVAAIGAQSATAPTATPGAQPSGIGPSGFINFSSYLNANRDVAKRTAGQVTGRLDQNAQKARTGLAGAYGQFANQMRGGTTKTPGSNFTVTSSPQAARWANAAAAHASPAPATYISREDAERAAAGYSGPEGLSDVEGFDKLRADTKRAQDEINATGMDGGLEALLREQYGRTGQYTQGQSGLDAALTGAVGRKDFADQRRKNADLYGDLKRTESDSVLQVGGAKAGSEEAAKTYRSLIEDYDAAEKKKAEDAANKGKPGSKTHATLDDYRNSDSVGNLANAPGHMTEAASIGSVGGGWAAGGSAFSAGLNNLIQAGVRAVAGRETARGLQNGMKYTDPTQWDEIGDDGGNMVDFSSLGSDDIQGQVYNSMTQAELDSVAAMTPEQQAAWLAKRKEELGL